MYRRRSHSVAAYLLLQAPFAKLDYRQVDLVAVSSRKHRSEPVSVHRYSHLHRAEVWLQLSQALPVPQVLLEAEEEMQTAQYRESTKHTFLLLQLPASQTQ